MMASQEEDPFGVCFTELSRRRLAADVAEQASLGEVYDACKRHANLVRSQQQPRAFSNSNSNSNRTVARSRPKRTRDMTFLLGPYTHAPPPKSLEPLPQAQVPPVLNLANGPAVWGWEEQCGLTFILIMVFGLGVIAFQTRMKHSRENQGHKDILIKKNTTVAAETDQVSVAQSKKSRGSAQSRPIKNTDFMAVLLNN